MATQLTFKILGTKKDQNQYKTPANKSKNKPMI